MMLSLYLVVADKSWSMEIQSIGEDTLVLSGKVISGDCRELENEISKKLKKIILTNSGGGKASEGYCIGELIRKYKLNTEIRGRCASSCSRMWLGGVKRRLYDNTSRVGLHGNYRDGYVHDEGIYRLRNWIPRYSKHVDKELMEAWTELPYPKQMMYFFNDRAILCQRGGRGRDCKKLPGRNVFNAGLSDLKSPIKEEKIENKISDNNNKNCEGNDKLWHNCIGEKIYRSGKYKGNWNFGERHGHGTWVYSRPAKVFSEFFGTNSKFIGQFKNHYFYEGTAISANGDKYVGQFGERKTGFFNGKGTMYYADGRVDEGIWEDGRLVKN